MDNLKLFEEFLGGWWAGVRFHKGAVPGGNVANRPMRFCEAIAEARNGPIILTEDLASCVGSRQSFGWNSNESVADHVSEKSGMDLAYAQNIVTATPHLDGSVSAIEIGTHENPDVMISFEQPESAMKLINMWQRFNGQDLKADISTFMAVCGSVAVRAYLTGTICLSFGCPESREYGNISRDRLVVGVPFPLIKELVSSMNNERNHERPGVHSDLQPAAGL